MLMFRYFAMAMAAFVVLFSGPASAGDFAERRIFGFSPDGRYFAFEEYGIQDGSGFPYSNTYMIDTAGDRWLPGTPVRVRIDKEDATIDEVRLEARSKAEPKLQQLEISNQPVHAASNPVTQLNADFNFVLINPRNVVPPIDQEYAFRLSAFPLPGPAHCADFGETRGFDLDLIHGPDDTRIVLQHDRQIPESRSCPLDYQIADIYTFYPQSAPPVFAVLIRMLRVGFEGPDGRYLAVTGRLPQ